jgi:hypothetical protein
MGMVFVFSKWFQLTLQAYLLATANPIYKAVAQRIHAMYFLGTPHRGADSAQVARVARSLSGQGVKSYVDELVPGSLALNVCSPSFISFPLSGLTSSM